MIEEFYDDYTEYNIDSINQISLTNLGKMLLARREYKGKFTLDNFLEQVLDTHTNDRYFVNDLVNIGIYIYPEDSLKKIDGGDDLYKFINENKGPKGYKIIIAKKATPKMIHFFEDRENWELLFNKELSVDKASHILQPKFILLSEEEQEKVRQEYNLEPGDLATIVRTDQMSRYYKLKKNEIIKIIRPSPTSCESVIYRQRE